VARRTIEREASLSGPGLHTGADVTVTFRPAPAGRRVVFRRTDLPGTPEIAARLEEVEATDRRTVLGQGDQAVHTVEHVMAAVGALGIDDLYIDLDGPEPPALDGSFRPWFEALQGAGERMQDGSPVIYRVLAPFTVTEGESSYVVSPAGAGRVTVTIEFPHPLIRSQAGSYAVNEEVFGRELAGARTFGFMHEVEALKAKGLIKGASPANAVVLTEAGLMEGTELRWPDEFVRHKAADLIGDLALIGGRVEAHIVATRPSHQGNVALARAIARTGQREGGVAMDIGRILDVIPHRYPFLLVDRIIEIEGKKRIVGIKNVTINEPFFQGHFPGHPIMPGVLIIEAMAQVGGMLLLGSLVEAIEEKVIYFMSLDKVKFRRPVLPGDQLRFELEMLQFRGKTCKMQGVAYVDGKVAVEAEMMAAVVDR
jgi:UDP-3-O-[3-hydroxymyristoyl] N-acetylglucosamine deacetylase/3-hydroxyacyl-[acyl-carrier-protein] dehydratase